MGDDGKAVEAQKTKVAQLKLRSTIDKRPIARPDEVGGAYKCEGMLFAMPNKGPDV